MSSHNFVFMLILEGKLYFTRAENFRMVDIEINA